MRRHIADPAIVRPQQRAGDRHPDIDAIGRRARERLRRDPDDGERNIFEEDVLSDRGGSPPKRRCQ